MPQKITHRPTKTLILLSAVLACMPGPARADRGVIRTEPINIEEPAQRAIIAFNGACEWLILQTDVRAEKVAKIVEFMPLPAKPEVSLAPEGCFATLRDLVVKHNLRYPERSGSRAMGAGGAEAAEYEPVEVVVSAQLGPHAVTVAEVRNVDAFIAWVRDFFREHDLGEPGLPQELREIVADYLARDLRFFAFDIVTVSPEQQTVQPLTYVFRTTRLYYPLVVTNLYGGNPGTVELFTLLPEGLAYRFLDRNPVAFDYSVRDRNRRQDDRRWRRTTAPAKLQAQELAGLHPDLPKRLGAESVVLWANKYEGPLHFEYDLCNPLGYANHWECAQRFLAALAENDRDVLEILVATPFALAGQEIVFDREKLLRALGAGNRPPGVADEGPKLAVAPGASEIGDDLTIEFVDNDLRANGHDYRVLRWNPRTETATYYVLVMRTGHGYWRVVGFVKQ